MGSTGIEVPDYVYSVIKEMRETDLTLINRAKTTRVDPILFSVVRNEMDRLPEFLDHHRKIGVKRFTVIDNNSSDGSREFLAEQPDVELLFTDRKFAWERKQGWIYLAMMMAGRGSDTWFMYADADEHLVYEGAPGRQISDVVAAMDNAGIRRVRGTLIDMYPDGPLLAESDTAKSLRERYPYFDGQGYIEAKYPQIISIKGGPRRRVFSEEDKDFRPELTKYPLFKLVMNEIFANPHHIWPYPGNFESPRYLGILHYKFLPGLTDRITRAVAEKTYWEGSLEYRCYQSALRKNPNLSLMSSSSRRYECPDSLIECGLIAPLDPAKEPRSLQPIEPANEDATAPPGILQLIYQYGKRRFR